MSCSKWVEQISRMVDGSLAGENLKRLDEHLAGCPGCRAELVLQKSIETALSAEAHSGLPADFTERVGAAAIRIEKKSRRAKPWLVLVPPLATATAAAALFLLGMDLADHSPSMFEPIAGALVEPIAWFSQAIMGMLAGAAEFQRQYVPVLDRVSGPTGGVVLAMFVGAVSVLWGFRRILVYLK